MSSWSTIAIQAGELAEWAGISSRVGARRGDRMSWMRHVFTVAKRITLRNKISHAIARDKLLIRFIIRRRVWDTERAKFASRSRKFACGRRFSAPAFATT
jgi:hypothetical protein